MKQKQQIEWVSEKVAAEILGYKPRTVRKYVLWGKLPFDFTTVFGRKYKYNKVQIDEWLLSNSSVVNKKADVGTSAIN